MPNSLFSRLHLGAEKHQLLQPVFGNSDSLPPWLLPWKPLGCSTSHNGWMESKVWRHGKPARRGLAQLRDTQPSQLSRSICTHR